MLSALQARADAALLLTAGHAGDSPRFVPVLEAIRVLRVKQRHAVECGINQLKRHRAVASRYDKLGMRYLATIRIAAIGEWLPKHQ